MRLVALSLSAVAVVSVAAAGKSVSSSSVVRDVSSASDEQWAPSQHVRSLDAISFAAEVLPATRPQYVLVVPDGSLPCRENAVCAALEPFFRLQVARTLPGAAWLLDCAAEPRVCLEVSSGRPPAAGANPILAVRSGDSKLFDLYSGQLDPSTMLSFLRDDDRSLAQRMHGRQDAYVKNVMGKAQAKQQQATAMQQQQQQHQQAASQQQARQSQKGATKHGSTDAPLAQPATERGRVKTERARAREAAREAARGAKQATSRKADDKVEDNDDDENPEAWVAALDTPGLLPCNMPEWFFGTDGKGNQATYANGGGKRLTVTGGSGAGKDNDDDDEFEIDEEAEAEAYREESVRLWEALAATKEPVMVRGGAFKWELFRDTVQGWKARGGWESGGDDDENEREGYEGLLAAHGKETPVLVVAGQAVVNPGVTDAGVWMPWADYARGLRNGTHGKGVIFSVVDQSSTLASAVQEPGTILAEVGARQNPSFDDAPATARGILTLASGNRGSQNGLHAHGIAVNALLAGRKHWVVLEPGNFDAFPGDLTPPVGDGKSWTTRGGTKKEGREHLARWLTRGGRHEGFKRGWAKEVWQCTQKAGDVVFVPSLLIHGIVNLDDDTCAITAQHRDVLVVGDSLKRDHKTGQWVVKRAPLLHEEEGAGEALAAERAGEGRGPFERAASVLHLAVRTGHAGDVRRILAAATELARLEAGKKKETHQATATATAAAAAAATEAPGTALGSWDGDPSTIAKALAESTSTISLPEEERSMLCLAALGGHAAVVRALVEAGAAVDLSNADGAPLLCAARGAAGPVRRSFLAAAASMGVKQDLDKADRDAAACVAILLAAAQQQAADAAAAAARGGGAAATAAQEPSGTYGVVAADSTPPPPHRSIHRDKVHGATVLQVVSGLALPHVVAALLDFYELQWGPGVAVEIVDV